MQAKQMIITELENLNPNQLSLIHSLIKSWQHDIIQTETTFEEQKRIGEKSRMLLSSIKGSLGDEIIKNRDDRF